MKFSKFHVLVRLASLLAFVFLFAACAHDPKQDLPAWTQQPARTVDGGYIVYVEHGEAASQEAAQFKAEGLALEDLANECSFIPKGARIEDRAALQTKNGYEAIVKLGIEFEECQTASKTNDPEEVKKLANVPFTQQVKRYQDFAETGQMAAAEQVAELSPPAEVAPMPSQGAWDDRTHFYVVRQYVAYQKEVVILSPPATYAPGSPQLASYNTNVLPATTNLQTAAAKDPTLVKAPPVWSHVPNRPEVGRPEALRASVPAHARAAERSLRAPPRAAHTAPGQRRRGGKGRRRKSTEH